MYSRKIIFLFLNQNICRGYSKEPSQNMCQKLLVRKYLQFYAENFCLSKPFILSCVWVRKRDVLLICLCFGVNALGPSQQFSVMMGQLPGMNQIEY